MRRRLLRHAVQLLVAVLMATAYLAFGFDVDWPSMLYGIVAFIVVGAAGELTEMDR